MATTPVQSLTNVGNIADGDKLIGERVDGTTVRVTFNGVLLDSEFTTNGLMIRTGADSWANRTITGVSNRTTITNGDGVSGNPTIDISASYVGQSSITTLGTITTGVWNGTVGTVPYGFSGRATATAYAPIFGGTTSTGAHQSGTAGISGQLLQSGGASAIAGWTTATYPTTAGTSGTRLKSDGTNWINSTTTMPDAGTSGKLIRGNGTNYVETTATFADTYTASNLLYSNGSNTVTGLATANNGVLVTSSGGVPSIATDIPTAVTIGGGAIYRAGGTDVAVADGGTGTSSATAYAVQCGGTTSTGAHQSIASVGTAGQVLTSNGPGALPTMQDNAAAVGTVPAGAIIAYGGTSAPTGYLACDGSAVSRSTYSALFTAISTTWGVGDGSTTFNVPNLNRRTLIGSGGSGTGTIGNAVGNTGGEENHTMTLGELVGHTHTGAVSGTAAANSGGSFTAATSTTGNTGSTGSATPFNVIQPSAVVKYCIKT